MSKNIVDFNDAIIRSFIEKNRPQEEIRDQLDLGYSYDGRNVEIYEIRPQWNDPQNILHLPFARITYVKSRKIWKLYWMRASGKWQSYEPFPQSTSLKKILTCIDEDRHACFKG